MTNPAIRTQAKPVYTEIPPRAWFLYGEAKVGKTETAAGFPRPLILNPKVEDRTSEIAGDVWDIPIGDTGQLKAAITYLQSGKHSYQYIVFDAATAYIDDIIAKQEGNNPLRKVRAANNVLIPILTDFFALPIGKILTGHAKHDTEQIDNMNTKHNIYPDLPQSFRTFITARVTAYGYCYPAQGGSKVRWTALEQPKLSIAAGNSLGLPDVTDLRYDAIYRAVVKKQALAQKQSSEPTNGAQQPLGTPMAKWFDFVKQSNLTPTTIEAALGTDKPSEWLASNKGKTIDDVINIVKQFVAKVGKPTPEPGF